MVKRYVTKTEVKRLREIKRRVPRFLTGVVIIDEIPVLDYCY